MNIYKFIATAVWVISLVFHLVFIHVVMAFTLTADTNPLWGIPFALVYAIFIGFTLGICYHYILPKKSQKYWHN
jgi:uncharacterized membrane-anchored protein YitT (DUF2179 family)